MANVINFNDNDNDNNQQSVQQQTVTNAVSPFVSGGQQPQQSAPMQQNKSASSGQFTNIQKYLNANKGAGEQISGNVQNRINKNLQPGIKQQETETQKVAAGVQAANDTLQRGQGYQQELSAPGKQASLPQAPGVPSSVNNIGFQAGLGADLVDPNIYQRSDIQQNMQPGGIQPQSVQPQPQTFNPESFVNDTNKLTDFTKLRLGQGINEQQLKQQAEQSQALAGASETQAKDLFGRTRSAIGRTGLIGETFNRPNYTQGQQRLDNLFLTGAGKKGINAIQDVAKSNVASAGERLKQAGLGVQNVSNVASQEQTLQQALQNRANELESGYINSLESLVPEVNTMRDADRARWQKNFDILTGKTQGTMDQDIFDELQLRNNERSFNVLNDPNLTLRQIANISDRNAQNYRDVASQSDVDYYKKLAQLSKGTLNEQGQFVNPDDLQLQLTQASDMGKAAASKTGENSLRGRLDTALKDFLDKAKTTNITGVGTDEGTSSIFGSGGTATAQAQLNLANYLNQVKDSGLSAQANAAAPNLAQLGLYGTNPIGSGSLDALSALTGGNTITNTLGNTISGIAGSDSGSSAAANYRAQNALIDSLNNYLTNAGYGNFITTTGKKNVDDLSRQAAAIEQDRLDVATRRRYDILNQTPEQLQKFYQQLGNPNVSIDSIKAEQERLRAELNEKMASEDSAVKRLQDQMNQRLGITTGSQNNPALANLNLMNLMKKG